MLLERLAAVEAEHTTRRAPVAFCALELLTDDDALVVVDRVAKCAPIQVGKGTVRVSGAVPRPLNSAVARFHGVLRASLAS